MLNPYLHLKLQVQGWNEITLVYTGRNMHAMVNNWKGGQETSIPMTGNFSTYAVKINNT